MNSRKFPCRQCGICCMHIDRIDILSRLDRGDGQCIYLKNRKCSIYEERPDICNVDKMYDMFFRDKMSKTEYYQRNLQGCNEIRKWHENFQEGIKGMRKNIPEEIGKKVNFVENLSGRIFSLSQDVFKQIEKMCGEDDTYDVLRCRLLIYLNQCLDSGEIPDWNLIMQGTDEKTPLPVHERYRSYVLEHLLSDGYIEGILVKENPEGKGKIITETSGIQITPRGKRFLKSNSVVGRVTKIINNIIPFLDVKEDLK